MSTKIEELAKKIIELPLEEKLSDNQKEYIRRKYKEIKEDAWRTSDTCKEYQAELRGKLSILRWVFGMALFEDFERSPFESLNR